MLAQKFELVNSELRGQVDPDNATVVIEPTDRTRGFGVAMELAEAISFARMVLEMAGQLNDDYDTFVGRQLDAIDEDAYFGRL